MFQLYLDFRDLYGVNGTFILISFTIYTLGMDIDINIGLETLIQNNGRLSSDK